MTTQNNKYKLSSCGEIVAEFSMYNEGTNSMRTLTITSTVKTYPKLDFLTMKEAIVGKRYQVSLTFVGPARAKALNQQYRKKDYVPNVLSFPLDENIGEVIICPAEANKEAKDFDFSPAGHIAFLFIHGLLHLKGYGHGATMEKLEAKYVRKFKIK